MEEDLAKALNQQGACDDEDAEWLVSTIGGATSNSNNNNAIEDDFDILDEDGEVVQPDPPVIEEVAPAKTETTNTPAADATADTSPITSNNDDDGYADMADFEDDNVLMDDDNVAAAAPSSGDHEPQRGQHPALFVARGHDALSHVSAAAGLGPGIP